MPATRPSRCDQTYALRLPARRPDDAGLAGELEHVLSGDCRSFDSGADLLSALQALQALQAQRAQPVAVTPGTPCTRGTPGAPGAPVTPDYSLEAQR